MTGRQCEHRWREYWPQSVALQADHMSAGICLVQQRQHINSVCRSHVALTTAPTQPTLPTEGSTPACTNRSVYLIETYWLPRSL